MINIDIDVIERLKDLRSRFKMTQTDFGKALGMSQGNVSEMERGKFNPSIDTVISACKYFKVSADWLLMGVNHIPSHNMIRETPSELTVIKKQENYTDIKQKSGTTCDPELKQMYDVLENLMQSGDINLRGWAIIQFKRAFSEYYVANKTDKIPPSQLE